MGSASNLRSEVFQSYEHWAAVFPGARVGATLQFGLVGEEAVSKKYAVGTDMSLAGPVKLSNDLKNRIT